MKRLYNKYFQLTRSGNKIDEEGRAFIKVLVAKYPRVDPIDFRDVITQSIQLELIRLELDSSEKLLSKKKRRR